MKDLKNKHFVILPFTVNHKYDDVLLNSHDIFFTTFVMLVSLPPLPRPKLAVNNGSCDTNNISGWRDINKTECVRKEETLFLPSHDPPNKKINIASNTWVIRQFNTFKELAVWLHANPSHNRVNKHITTTMIDWDGTLACSSHKKYTPWCHKILEFIQKESDPSTKLMTYILTGRREKDRGKTEAHVDRLFSSTCPSMSTSVIMRPDTVRGAFIPDFKAAARCLISQSKHGPAKWCVGNCLWDIMDSRELDALSTWSHICKKDLYRQLEHPSKFTMVRSATSKYGTGILVPCK